MTLKIIPIKTGLIKRGDDPISKILNSLPEKPLEKDVLVISTKPLLIAYGLIIKPESIKPSKEAYLIAEEYNIEPWFGELIIRYSDCILGGVERVVSTIIDNIVVANASIDRKNVGGGMVSMPFTALKNVAKKFFNAILEKYRVKVGIIISDSVVYPLRRGTSAVAVYVYGFNPVKDYRGYNDLYGRRIIFTQMALADSIAAAAHIVMGEGNEMTPAALVRGVDIELIDGDTTNQAKMTINECMYKDMYINCKRYKT